MQAFVLQVLWQKCLGISNVLVAGKNLLSVRCAYDS